jgi:hypothetical protein
MRAGRQTRRHDLGRDGRVGNFVAEVGLDLRERNGKFLAGEADGIALSAGARRAADAMHVVRRILRQIVVEDVADVGNVQTARGDVRCNEHSQLAFVEIAQEFQAFVLRHVARKRLGMKAIRPEYALEPLRHAFGVDEDHRAARFGLAQESNEERQFLLH